MPKAKYQSRKFLNDNPQLTAMISVFVPSTKNDYPVFMLSDCSRVVSLDFSIYDARDRKQSLKKAHLLKETVVKFVDALEGLCKELDNKNVSNKK